MVEQIATFHFSFYPMDNQREKLPVQTYRWGLFTIAGTTLLFLSWLFYHWFIQPNWVIRLPTLLTEWIQLAEAAGIFTITFIWSAILWRQRRQIISSPPLPDLTLDQLYNLSPRAFERYVADLFLQKGYQVRVRGRSGDLGVDLEISDGQGRRAIAQCKRYQKTIGAETVRELYGTLIHERANRAFLVTTAEISTAAREWVKGKPITLIDGKTLVQISTSLKQP